MQTREKTVWQLLEQVPDPEIPVLSIVDLGIVRQVTFSGETLTLAITPTYSGCPAMDMIGVNIRAVLQDAGYGNIEIKNILSPAWTTDWLSAKGREKLLAYGIAPPSALSTAKMDILGEAKRVACPLCGSSNTELLSQFGSTACKALFRCKDCLEPFDYFKCH
jgi:ring-1,2-phenylacetyl-CoA epoxidase subunit PaaD